MRAHSLKDESGTVVSSLCLGAMSFGTTIDEPTAFAILDRFVAAGGTTIDTANCYAYWVPNGLGGESETVLGRWLESRRNRDSLVLASKVGSGPGPNGTSEGLSARVIREQLTGSLRRLGTEHLDIYYAHREDRSTPDEETLSTFHDAVKAGTVRSLGASNHPAWRVAETRSVALANGWTPYSVVQQRYSYALPRPATVLPEGGHVHATDDLLDYVRSRDLVMFAYTTLLWGSYGRSDKPLPEHYDHPGTDRRLAALADVAGELGVSVNQVVLAWLMGGDPAIVPIIAPSSVEQLEDCLGAAELELPSELRKRLDEAR